MNIPKTVPELTSLFQKLGAPNPESWARSQIEEGIPQLQRYLFLRQAWRNIIADDSSGWIDAELNSAAQDPEGPYAGVGASLRRALEAGASRDDLTQIARGMQAQLLFGICYLLDDPNIPEPELGQVSWGLFQTDEEGTAVERISGLHESVLETDPTGREMRPKKR